MNSRTRFLSLLSVGAACAALAGCYIPGISPVGTATISYSQVGACNGDAAAPARPNQAYVIFKVEDVDNSKGNVDFLFLPTRLYVDQSSEKEKATWIGGWKRQFVSEETKFLKDLGGAAAATKAVPHNGKTAFNSFVFVAVGTVNSNGSAEANQTPYTLAYDSEPVQGETNPAVTLNKTNATQKTWPATESCQDIKLP